MTDKNKFNWQDGLRIVLAVLTFGFGWIADNQATVISFSAVFIVWGIGLAIKKYGYQPTKAVLTIIVFAVALGLSLIFQPILLPMFPGWTGDASTFAPLFLAYMTAFLQIASGVVAYATGVYNILLSHVLEKIPTYTNKLLGLSK